MNHDYDRNIELYGNSISPEQIIESDGLTASYAIEEFLKSIHGADQRLRHLTGDRHQRDRVEVRVGEQ